MSQVVLAKPRTLPALQNGPLLALAALLIAAFAPLWAHYWTIWTADHGAFGFGYLVPPSVVYLVWANRDRLTEAGDSKPKSVGWILLGVFACIQTLASLAEVRTLEGLSMMGILLAGAYCLIGPLRFKIVWPALAYTATMIPWPGDLTLGLLFRLQQWSIQSSTWLLGLLGQKPSMNGTLLNLPHYWFEIAPDCAGLTVLFPVMACAIFTAITLDVGLPNKLTYVVIAAPISVLTNTLRIVLIGLIGNGGGAATAARLHDASGIFSVLICLGILALIGKLIGCNKYLPQYAPTRSPEEKQS